MDDLFAILAAGVGFLIAGLELITGKYPRTWFLLKRSGSLWSYCGIYGAISGCAFLGVDALISSGKLQIEVALLGEAWVKALVVGVSVKSLLHINLFNVSVNAQPFPVGLETFVQLFEPQLLRNILFDEFNEVRRFVAPAAASYTDIEDVRTKIARNIPHTLPSQEVGAFKDELSKSVDVAEVLEKGLRFLGRKTFARIFP